jgi:hypothetical protein
VRARPACRLHFILARAAPVGVLFRRGPTLRVELVRWNLGDDTFDRGQWFHGRIYERRSDLSPDGTRLVYFAKKMNRHTLQDEDGYTFAWTAVSRAPYLAALALWPKGDCWNGGGLFETDRELWLNHFASQARAHPRHPPPSGLTVTGTAMERGEDDTVLARRLQRDGWRLLQSWKGRFVESEFSRACAELTSKGLSTEEQTAELLRRKLYRLSTASRWITERPEVREKPSPDGRHVLSMTKALRSFGVILRFQVHPRDGGTSLAFHGAEWADWDRHGRLAFVARGKLMVAEPRPRGGWIERELADFNDDEPRPVEAPAWATRW